MNRMFVALSAIVLLSPPLAHSNSLCNGATGTYAEDLIAQLLERSKGSIDKNRVEVERFAANLPVWLSANQKIGKTAGFVQRLLICDLPGLNAFVTTKSEPVRIHAETVAILGAKEEVIAALLGHEYSHLSLNHAAQRITAARMAKDWAVGRAYGILQRTRNSEEAVRAGVTLYAGQMSAFSIKHELEADDFGIQLLGKSGYRPSAFFGLASIGKYLYGDTSAKAFPTHPGFIERMMRGGDRVTDETFDQTAADFRANDDFHSMSNLVKEWMSRLPDSGNARYYKAILLRQSKSPNATETMEDALLPTRKPAISQRIGDTELAWLWLCTQLYREGFAVESAWCGETQLRPNAQLWAKFQRRTFQDRMWVGYRGDRNSGDGTLYLGFIRKSDGTKLITNSASTAELYGVAAEQYTPLWRPIRFVACKATKEMPCPREHVEPSLAVKDSDANPLLEVRANCKPPTCLRND